MSKELQLEEEASERPLQLLVPWSSPWQEFRTAIGPALGPSPRPLAGEARSGLFPFRNMPLVCLVEFLLLAMWAILPGKLAQMRPKLPAAPPKYDVLYFSADELPRTEDNGGASAGAMGRAGGLHAFHRTQAIRVVRGEVLREKVLDAPKLNLPHSEAAVANLFAYKAQVPGPAPTEGLSARKVPSLSANPVAPAPQNTVHRDTLLTAPKLDATVVPPAPNQIQTEALPVRLPGSQRVQVIPPPVSAPERAATSTPRLTLPAPSVIAPPPSQITQDLAKTGSGYGRGELHPQVVPPAVQVNGTQDRHALSGLGSAAIVPPPVEAGSGPLSAHKLGDWNNATPVAPAVKAPGGSLPHSQIAGLATTVVPPPPNVSPTNSLGPTGQSTRTNNLAAALDAVSVSAPPAGSKTNATGVVISSQPGTTQAVPSKAGAGALALSPTGGAKPGIGGSRGGAGIDFGTGTGSGPTGGAAGASTAGMGHAADTSAKSGISPYPGKGGAGSGNIPNPPVPGVSVHGGGSNIVTLPSFSTNGVPPSSPTRSGGSPGNLGAGLTVIATSRSGGAFDLYGKLPGDNYTIYLPTTLGTAVMQFADPTSSQHSYSEALTSPRPLRTNLPPKLTPARLILSCTLDRTGLLGDLRVLEPASAEMTAQVVAALRNWKFTPAMRGTQPVQVNVLLGFDIDTR